MDVKLTVQRVGRFLSGMVQPNIGAFIAWGLITAFFIPTGWMPNEQLAVLVGPMVKYLLPLLIGYTGGQMIAGVRGGVVGSIFTIGVIAGTADPQFMGAMIVGPLGGYIIKRFDKLLEGKIPTGFEMLVNNFSVGIIGGLLAIISIPVVGPFMAMIADGLSHGVASIVNRGLLPLVALIVEPAKILFLNNALNHGVFTPLGAEQVQEFGKSIFYLIETNPGPGLGILLAYTLAGKGSAKSSAPGAIIIHFLGGIHEIYFPYVLMTPALFLAVIAGGVTGIFINVIFNTGLVAVASPGSILAILAVAAPGSHLGIIFSVAAAAAVSFVVAVPFVRANSKNDESFSAAQEKQQAMKAQAKGADMLAASAAKSLSTVKKIVVACDAGMGSSAMGATMMKKKLLAANVSGIEVVNSAIDAIPSDADLVITQENLAVRAEKKVEGRIPVRRITNFMNGKFYEELIEEIQGK